MSKASLSGVDAEELDEFLDSAPESLQDWAQAQREELKSGPAPASSKLTKPTKTSTARGINKVLVALLAAAVVLLIQQWGQPGPTPETEAASAAQSGMPSGHGAVSSLDETRVAELEAVLEQDPSDVQALRELAALHNDAGLWDDAADYHEHVLALEPADVDTLLALGVIQFNQGDADAAEQTWLKASEAAPEQPEPWFNLGFAYLGKEPADTAKATQMWEKLIEVAPDSELAGTAQSHIDGIAGG